MFLTLQFINLSFISLLQNLITNVFMATCGSSIQIESISTFYALGYFWAWEGVSSVKWSHLRRILNFKKIDLGQH